MLWFVIILFASLRPALAADDAMQAEIRSALTQWSADFNARKADKVCALFALDVRADIRSQPERNHEGICDVLTRSVNDSTRSYAYSQPDIKEILIFGDVAVVRLVWTLTVTAKDGSKTKTIEPGMDVFGRQADGSWKIERYMSYEQ